MKYKLGDTVKFLGRKSPCIVYQVVDPVEQLLYCKELGYICAHVKLEVIGFIPVELLESAVSSPDNIPALDFALNHSNRLN